MAGGAKHPKETRARQKEGDPGKAVLAPMCELLKSKFRMRNSVLKGMTSGFFSSSSNISLLTFETKNKPYMNLHCVNIWLDRIYYFPLLKDPQSSVLIQAF